MYVSCEVFSSIKLREIVCTIYSMIWPSVKDFIALIFMTRYCSKYIVNILFFMAVIVQPHSQTSVSSNHGGTNLIICHHALVTKFILIYSPWWPLVLVVPGRPTQGGHLAKIPH